MVSETLGSFDIRAENSKHFLAPLIRGEEERLKLFRADQSRYLAMLNLGLFQRWMNRAFYPTEDHSEDIQDIQDSLNFYHQLLTEVDKGEYQALQEYLVKHISHIVTKIEQLQRRFSDEAVPWSTVYASLDVPVPKWFLTQGMILLNQLDPTAAAPLNDKLSGLKILKNRVSLGQK